MSSLSSHIKPPSTKHFRFYISRQQVGSIQETDAEHGAAHILEHLAFNGE
jgi:predicted Zn-dependent peptidase